MFHIVLIIIQGSQTATIFVNITDDIATGEPLQQYDLMLSQVPSGVIFAPFQTTTINISDDDCKIL